MNQHVPMDGPPGGPPVETKNVKCCACKTSDAVRYVTDINYDNFFYCQVCPITQTWHCGGYASSFTQDECNDIRVKCEYTDGCSKPAIDWVYKWYQLAHRVQKKTFVCQECVKIHN